MIAWRLSVDFNTQEHLFYKKIEADYIITAYICHCGHTEFVIHNHTQVLNYRCMKCENIQFYNANAAWENSNFLHQYRDLDFTFEYAIKTNKNSINSMYVTKIPRSIDFLKQKILFEKKTVCNIKLTMQGELIESYLLRCNEKKFSQLKKNLSQYININKSLDIPYSNDIEMTLKIASFFLKNKHLKSFDFYYWIDTNMLKNKDFTINSALTYLSNYPKAKSVKKAVYTNYLRQMQNSKSFDATFIEVFTTTIEDINILVKLLSIKLEYSRHSNIDKSALIAMIFFLKQYYSEKQLLKMFLSDEFKMNKYLFRDAIREFSFNKGILEENFRKVPCKVNSLHDEFVRCSREERDRYIKNQTLEYTVDEQTPCIYIDEHQIKLPQTGKELYQWADTLHNCMAGYFDEIKTKETLIYGFFQKDILTFAVEIKGNSIIQASEKYNADLNVENEKILQDWFKSFFNKTFRYTSGEFINDVYL